MSVSGGWLRSTTLRTSVNRSSPLESGCICICLEGLKLGRASCVLKIFMQFRGLQDTDIEKRSLHMQLQDSHCRRYL